MADLAGMLNYCATHQGRNPVASGKGLVRVTLVLVNVWHLSAVLNKGELTSDGQKKMVYLVGLNIYF